LDNTTPKLRVAILSGILELYNRCWPQTKQRLQVFIEETAERLRGQGFEVSTGAAVSSAEQAKEVCKKVSAERCDLLAVSLSLYCPSGVLQEALKETDMPVLLWPAQGMYELTPQSYDPETIALNHGVHAVQDIANVLGRNGKAFGVIHGHVEQEDFLEDFRSWAQAGRAIGAMRRAKPVQIGGHFEDMLDLQVGDKNFIKETGVTPIYVSQKEFSRLLKTADKKTVQEYVQSYKEKFNIEASISEELLEKTTRGNYALDNILAKHQSAACGLNFVELCNDEGIGDALHVAASMLMAQGGGYAGEGDWVTAAFIYGMQQAFGAASFSEIFSVGYKDNRLVLKHWGEGNFTMARSKPMLRPSKLPDKHPAEFVIVDFEFEPGEACLINLSCDRHGQGQIISIAGEITQEHLPKATGPRAVFKPETKDVRKLLTDYAYQGGSHHLALVKSDGRKILERMGKLAGWSYISL